MNPETLKIVAQTLTDNGAHDAGQVEPLLEQVGCGVQTFYGDGAYDQWKVYRVRKIRAWMPIIPPRDARIKLRTATK